MPYRDYFSFRKITRYHINLFLGIEFYFGRRKELIPFLKAKDEPLLQKYIELKAKLKEIDENADKIHELIAERGVQVIDEIMAERENIQKEMLEIEEKLKQKGIDLPSEV